MICFELYPYKWHYKCPKQRTYGICVKIFLQQNIACEALPESTYPILLIFSGTAKQKAAKLKKGKGQSIQAK